MLDDIGGILSDVTVIWARGALIGANGLLTGPATRSPLESGTVADDITTSTCRGAGVHGRATSEPITKRHCNDGLRYFAPHASAAGVPVPPRVSYVGELGWEPIRRLPTVCACGSIMAAGAPHGIIAGGRVPRSPACAWRRYRARGSDDAEDTLEDAGLGFAVRMQKDGGFVGRDALEAQPSRGRRLVAFGMRMDAGRPEAGAPVFATATDSEGGSAFVSTEAATAESSTGQAADTEAVGWVTSADFGAVTGQVIGLAWVPDEHAEPGTRLGIMRFGRVLDAEVLAEPVYDSGMARIRR